VVHEIPHHVNNLIFGAFVHQIRLCQDTCGQEPLDQGPAQSQGRGNTALTQSPEPQGSLSSLVESTQGPKEPRERLFHPGGGQDGPLDNARLFLVSSLKPILQRPDSVYPSSHKDITQLPLTLSLNWWDFLQPSPNPLNPCALPNRKTRLCSNSRPTRLQGGSLPPAQWGSNLHLSGPYSTHCVTSLALLDSGYVFPQALHRPL
jgi:hypothetical protein